MATGPLGEEMSKFPLLFAKAACFGQYPSKTRPAKINNGTISLVNFGKGVLSITCHHVIECYHHRREREGDIVFQIGNVKLNPLVQLVDENTRIDVATIHLTELSVSLANCSDRRRHRHQASKAPTSSPPGSCQTARGSIHQILWGSGRIRRPTETLTLCRRTRRANSAHSPSCLPTR